MCDRWSSLHLTQAAVSTSYLEEVVDKGKKMVSGGKWEGLTKVLVLSVMAGVLGSSTQFGFNTGVINNPKEVSCRFLA